MKASKVAVVFVIAAVSTAGAGETSVEKDGTLEAWITGNVSEIVYGPTKTREFDALFDYKASGGGLLDVSKKNWKKQVEGNPKLSAYQSLDGKKSLELLIQDNGDDLVVSHNKGTGEIRVGRFSSGKPLSLSVVKGDRSFTVTPTVCTALAKRFSGESFSTVSKTLENCYRFTEPLHLEIKAAAFPSERGENDFFKRVTAENKALLENLKNSEAYAQLDRVLAFDNSLVTEMLSSNAANRAKSASKPAVQQHVRNMLDLAAAAEMCAYIDVPPETPPAPAAAKPAAAKSTSN